LCVFQNNLSNFVHSGPFDRESSSSSSLVLFGRQRLPILFCQFLWKVVQAADLVGWESDVNLLRIRQVEVGHDGFKLVQALGESWVVLLFLADG